MLVGLTTEGYTGQSRPIHVGGAAYTLNKKIKK